MNEDKATRYHRLRRRAGVLSLALSATVLVLLVFGGGAVAFRDAALDFGARVGMTGVTHARFAAAGFVILLVAVLEAVGLPLAWYRGFVLERRYGLSAESVQGWWRDRAKSAGVSLVLGLLGALFVYEWLRIEPDRWWLAAAAGFALAAVVLAHLAPVLLIPLFFRLRPLERPSLNTRLLSLAQRAGARVLGVYEWGLGDRTRRANAALVGVGRTRRILLSDTLLDRYSDDEIEIILAHELAHHVHGDIWRAIAAEAGSLCAAFWCAHLALRATVPALGLTGPDDVAGLPIILLAGGTVLLILSPATNLMSRRHERRADAYALELTGNPDAFVSAMRRLAAQNLAESEPSPLVEALFLSHPPIPQRIAAARRWSQAAG